jgi:mannose-6-phosphate isomerase-like protein (cupin superfamily)
MVEMIAGWEAQSPDEEQRHIQWAQNISQALAPYAFKGGYINLLDEKEQERVPLAFGPNYERLLDLKRTYDPDIGPPPHIHHQEDEAFYIQEGELEFQLGDQIVIATPGTFLYSPKGHLHSFRNKTTQRAKMLAWYMPAGIERFFAEIGVEVNSPDAPSIPATPAAIERVLAAAPKYGIEFKT